MDSKKGLNGPTDSQQAIAAWLGMIRENSPSRREIASKYNVKKLLLLTQGGQGYYPIQVPTVVKPETISFSTTAPSQEQAEQGVLATNQNEQKAPISLAHTLSIYTPQEDEQNLDFII